MQTYPTINAITGNEYRPVYHQWVDSCPLAVWDDGSIELNSGYYIDRYPLLHWVIRVWPRFH